MTPFKLRVRFSRRRPDRGHAAAHGVAMVALKGSILCGVCYPAIVSPIRGVVGALFLKETKARDSTTYERRGDCPGTR